VRARVGEQVLRLDVAVADAPRVQVRERAAHLVHVELDDDARDARRVLLQARVVLGHLVHGVGDELEHEVQVHLVFLRRGGGL
jgi:hypothetical protein